MGSGLGVLGLEVLVFRDSIKGVGCFSSIFLDLNWYRRNRRAKNNLDLNRLRTFLGMFRPEFAGLPSWRALDFRVFLDP